MIRTSVSTRKFGVLFENDEIVRAYRRAKECPWLDVVGIHSHIGSQIIDLEPFLRNVQLVASAVRTLKAEILVRGDTVQVIRTRARFSDLLRNQILLEDLK